MTDPIVQTFNLTKIFGNETLAVNNLTINVKPGIYGFLGPNGAGKTTTLKMLIGSLYPTQGKIEIFGKNAFGKNKIEIHKRIGYVPENPTYFMNMTGERLLEYIGALFNMSQQKINSRVSSLLKLVDLSDAKNRAIAKYSAGMKQRIGIAQALMNDPDLLILDEITSNLDPLGRNHIISLIKDLKKEGKTILISTHVLPEIQKMEADSIGIINKGQLIMEGSIKELNERLGTRLVRLSPNNPKVHNAVESFAINLRESLNELIFETENIEGVWKAITKLSLEENILIDKFISSGLEIEQIFMKALDNESESNKGDVI
ncbi:MAG: ATP-binding cassette domain-containing protein [Candidatus Lokiarchaeota archaeon]|nr:ATP-binding cassette domain-containing protein [Candidatus Lokiarchaeota archaeon]MBD3200917.1 ATP-binding cassette domain-containing protein [Candidatus Lokiarchaeota archaeon]